MSVYEFLELLGQNSQSLLWRKDESEATPEPAKPPTFRRYEDITVKGYLTDEEKRALEERLRIGTPIIALPVTAETLDWGAVGSGESEISKEKK